jgi:hypothetical protein
MASAYSFLNMTAAIAALLVRRAGSKQALLQLPATLGHVLHLLHSRIVAGAHVAFNTSCL